mgnify:CR=1 FL=1
MAIKDDMEDVQEAVINELITENGITNTLADGQVTETKILNNAVTTNKIANGAVTAAKLGSDVDLGQVNTGAVTEHKIANGAVTPAKLSQAYLPLTGGSVTGSVGIGENSPSAFLDIVANSSNRLIETTSAVSDQFHHVFLDTSGNFAGTIRVTGSSTSYNTSSDYRLKTDAQPMTGATARVQALNPVNFEWISDGTRVDGFLAHEAQEVVPESVTGTKDALDEEGNPEYQGIDQSKLVPLLTKALQEALTKIESLEARVASLENT